MAYAEHEDHIAALSPYTKVRQSVMISDQALRL